MPTPQGVPGVRLGVEAASCRLCSGCDSSRTLQEAQGQQVLRARGPPCPEEAWVGLDEGTQQPLALPGEPHLIDSKGLCPRPPSHCQSSWQPFSRGTGTRAQPASLANGGVWSLHCAQQDTVGVTRQWGAGPPHAGDLGTPAMALSRRGHQPRPLPTFPKEEARRCQLLLVHICRPHELPAP